jgi:hypothetical protein
MINPGIYDITCPQGATFDKTFTITVNGSLLNLTGYSAAMQVREAYNSSTALVSLTSSSGITLGGSAGTILVTITAAATAAIKDGFYSYDLEITSGSGVKDRVLQGRFIVTPEVTR